MKPRIGIAFVIAVALAGTDTLLPASAVRAQNARGCNLPPQFKCPEPRIVSFEAKPATIKPGGSVELVWVAENTGTNMMTVTPTVGTVVARGAARVTPAATTTYTLTVAGTALTRTVTVTVEGTTPVAASAVMETPTETPRMPDGKPWLQGVYSSFGGGGGRGRGGAGAGARAGGPAAPGARAAGPGGPAGQGAPAPPAAGQMANRPTLKPGMEKYIVPPPDPNIVVSECGVNNVPPSIGPYNFQIVQNPEYIVILYEYMHLFRVIPIGGTHQPGPSSWMGDSVGRWDGDTLVIETENFNTRSTVGGGFGGGFLHSEALKMVERIRRPAYGSLEWEITLEDPNVFVAPWRTTTRYNFHPEFKRVEEYICTENLKDYDYLVDPTKDIN
jgi:hypothetical protein